MQDNGIPVEIEFFPLTLGCKVTHPSHQDVPLKILIDKPFPGMTGLGILSSIAQ